jgi:hypothetical protein
MVFLRDFVGAVIRILPEGAWHVCNLIQLFHSRAILLTRSKMLSRTNTEQMKVRIFFLWIDFI